MTGRTVDGRSILARAEVMIEDLAKAQPGYVASEYRARNLLILSRLLKNPPHTLVDIGCGYGALAITVATLVGSRVVAIDMLPKRLEGVRERAGGHVAPHLCIGDVERGLPLRNAIADAVVATEVAEHLHNPGKLFAEARRVLRPGGQLIMTTPNAAAVPYLILRLVPKSIVRRMLGSWVHQDLHPDLVGSSPDHPDTHKREGFTERDLIRIARSNGLTCEESYTYRVPAPDRLLGMLPKRFAGWLAARGTRPLPGGLGLFAVFRLEPR